MSNASLFIRLYLDEDVSVLVANLLHPHGFDILTTRDAHNLGCDDATQLRYATEHHWTVLTHNRVDYELLHAKALRKQRPHHGILIANRRASDFELARRIMTLLNRFTAEEVVNQLLYLYAVLSHGHSPHTAPLECVPKRAPQARMLKPVASFVLASRGPSTYRTEYDSDPYSLRPRRTNGLTILGTSDSLRGREIG